MLRKVFGSSGSIAKASSIIFIITFISKIVAYLESVTVAAFFGTSIEIDMFYLANSITVRFVFTIFAGLGIVGVSMYNNAVADGGNDKGNRFVSALLAIIIPIAVLTTLFLFCFAPLISDVMSVNYTVHERDMICQYIRTFSFVAVFYAISIILIAVLNANRRFVPGALGSLIQNITLIVFVVFLTARVHVWAVVIGSLCAYIVQGVFLYICARQVMSFSKFSLKEDLNVRKLLILLVPLVLGDASGEINLLVDQFISTELGSGYVSALAYGSSLDEFVSSFFVQTISSVLLPFFSVLAAEKKQEEISKKMRRVINTMVIVLLPITIVTVFTASNIVSIVYQRGNFDSNSVTMTAAALIGYGIGFIFKAIFVMIRRPFYAIENTRIPMYLSLFSVAVNITLTVILGRRWGVFGVTIATTVAFALGDVLAIVIMNKKIPGADWRGEPLFLGKLALAGIVSTIVVYIVARVTAGNNIASFGLCTVTCFAVYALCLWTLKMHEFRIMVFDVREILKRGR